MRPTWQRRFQARALKYHRRERTIEFIFPVRYAPGATFSILFPLAPLQAGSRLQKPDSPNRLRSTHFGINARGTGVGSAWILMNTNQRLVYGRNPHWKDKQGRAALSRPLRFADRARPVKP